MSRLNLLAASASTHLTKERKLSSVGLSGLALNMFKAKPNSPTLLNFLS